MKNHWQKVFKKKKRISEQMGEVSPFLDQFITAHGKLDSMSDIYWKASPEDFEAVILASGNSAPGPDGIAFECFKPVSQIAAFVFSGIFEFLGSPSTKKKDIPFECNEAWQIMLPTKPTARLPQHGDVYAPKDLRPLSIVSTCIAVALRGKIASLAERYVGLEQRASSLAVTSLRPSWTWTEKASASGTGATKLPPSFLIYRLPSRAWNTTTCG